MHIYFLPVHPKGIQPWIFIGRTDAEADTLATWWEVLTHWKRLWCWERLKAGGKGDDRGWDGWTASLTQWTWVWVNSGNWWWTGRPDMLQSMGSQRVGHNWVTELNWTEDLWLIELGCYWSSLHKNVFIVCLKKKIISTMREKRALNTQFTK